MLKRCSRGMWKFGVFCAVLFFAAAQLPAETVEAARDRNEVAMQWLFSDNTTMGVVKAFQFGNKQITPAQLIKIRKIVYGTFPKIAARARLAGVFDEYKAQLFDTEICLMNAKALDVPTVQELMELSQKQLAVIRDKYPKVYEWMNSDKELHNILMQMMQEIDAAAK